MWKIQTSAKLLLALLALSQSVGCAMLADYRSPEANDLQSLVDFSPKLDGARPAYYIEGVSEVAALPPVITVAREIQLHDTVFDRPIRNAAAQRERDRVFANASQKAIEQLQNQCLKAPGISILDQNTNHQCQSAIATQPDGCKELNAGSPMDASIDEATQSASLLFPRNVTSSPILLLAIAALVLSGVSWPLTRKPNRSHDPLVAKAHTELTPVVTVGNSAKEVITSCPMISGEEAIKLLTFTTDCLGEADAVQRDVPTDCPVCDGSLLCFGSLLFEESLLFEKSHSCASNPNGNTLGMAETFDENDVRLRLPYYQKRITYRQKRLNWQPVGQAHQERGLIASAASWGWSTQVILSPDHSEVPVEARADLILSNRNSLILTERSPAVYRENAVCANQTLVRTSGSVHCRKPFVGFVVLFDETSNSVFFGHVLAVESYSQEDEDCFVARISRPF